jgi:CHAD domain-containing protein
MRVVSDCALERDAMDAERSNGAAGAAAAPPRVAFRLDHRSAPRLQRVLARLALRAEPAETRAELVLDSFDHRLQAAGIGLSATGEPPLLRCRLARAGAPGVELELARLPAFAWDFPRPHAIALAGALEARGVQPIGVHEQTSARRAVLDDRAEVVAWIEEESHRVRALGDGGAWTPGERRIVLGGVVGHDNELRRIAHALGRAAGPRARRTEPFDPARLLEPPERPGRWPTLKRGVRAFAALGRIGRAQLEVLEANEAGMRAGSDAEHLHDARVALRRLRSLLGQLKGVFRAAERERMVGELRWLAGRLGPLRDVDTLLFRMRLADAELAAALRPATRRVERHRERLLAVLCADLDSPRFAKARELLRTRLVAGGARAHGGKRAAKPFHRVLARRLRRRLDAVTTRARALGAEGAPAELHELRIACKKLRYLLECCRGLVRKPALAPVFADLKALQSALGRIQDAEVHAQLVVRLARTHLASAGPKTWLALGRFQEQILADGRDARAHYAELAAAFAAPASQAHLEALLRALSPASEPAS